MITNKKINHQNLKDIKKIFMILKEELIKKEKIKKDK